MTSTPSAARLILRNQLAVMAAEQSHHLPCEASWRDLEAAMTETDVVLEERHLADAADLEMKATGDRT